MDSESSSPWGYRSYRDYLAQRFPGKVVRKLCLEAGFSCPNLDGTLGIGGCTFCNNRGFVPDAKGRKDLREQWERGKEKLRQRHGEIDGFIAYFQAFSNTHGPVEKLKGLYGGAMEGFDECWGMSISTRPDCLAEGVPEFLEELGKRTFLTVELGLQSDRDEVLKNINRGHDVACFDRAVNDLGNRSFDLCVHVMLGLPGEGDDAPERMGQKLASLPVRSLKVHNLHIMRGTAMAKDFEEGRLLPLSKEAYLDGLRRLIAELRPDQFCQRVIADAPDRLLLGDSWCQDKQAFLKDLGAGEVPSENAGGLRVSTPTIQP